MPITLGELATRFDCKLVGDAEVVVENVAGLQNAGPDSLSFLASSLFKEQLSSTKAAAVILRADDADDAPSAVLISDNPYAHYALMAAVIHPAPQYEPGVHPSAVISESAEIAASAHIAANATIGDRAGIGENAYVGPGSFVGPDCSLGDDGRMIANVTFVRQVTTGQRCIFHPGVVIGSDGFGNAMTPQGWVKVPQLGGVRIGSDVEIGANTTIDCGAVDDTVIEDGVRVDNLCMIAHNVHVGAHTAMAAMSAIAGSAIIGKRCLFGGQAGCAGHVRICDDVAVNGKAVVSKNIDKPGVYSNTFVVEPAREWSKQVARFRRLGHLIERVRKLEKSNK